MMSGRDEMPESVKKKRKFKYSLGGMAEQEKLWEKRIAERIMRNMRAMMGPMRRPNPLEGLMAVRVEEGEELPIIEPPRNGFRNYRRYTRRVRERRETTTGDNI